jgi:trans-aconitate methyltransferase
MTSGAPSSHEWDGNAYHRLSDPQHAWGRALLAHLPLDGDETVIDAGCGSGRLTAELLERLPRGHVVAVDRSANMLEAAREHLVPRFGARVSFECIDLVALAPRAADAVFSTATFHWLPDHDRLFRALAAALRPGGRLVAQCGGAGNVERVHQRAEALMRTPTFAPCFTGWVNPWTFADPETTRTRLHEAGFVHADAHLVPSPTPFADVGTFRAFLASVLLRVHLQHIPTPELKAQFLDAIVTQAATDTPPYELDYVRLNLTARRNPA